MSLTYWILTDLFLFFLGSCGGWVLEVFYRHFKPSNKEHKWYNPGFLAGPYLPIYGFGVLVLTIISTYELYFVETHDLIFYVSFFVSTSAIMTLMELVSGLILLKTSNLRLWDYRNEKFNYKGVVCLKFSIYWGIISILYYFFINPIVLRYVSMFIEHIEFSYVVGLISGFFLVDLSAATGVVIKISGFTRVNEKPINYEKLKEDIAAKRTELDNKKHFFVQPNRETVRDFLKEKYGINKED